MSVKQPVDSAVTVTWQRLFGVRRCAGSCRAVPTLALTWALMATLVACSTLEPSDEQTVTAAAGTPSAASMVGVLGETPLLGGDDLERQRLIDEINRDGRQPSARAERQTPPSPVAAPANDVVTLNYEQAELREVLAELADALDLTIVIDPSIDQLVSLRTAQNRPLAFADIWPLMRLLARQHGVALEQSGSVWYARRSESLLPSEITTADALAASTAAAPMQITPLVHVSATAAIQLLEPLLQPEGQVLRIANSNTLAITTSRSQLARVNELLNLIDDDPFRNQGIQLYPLSNASAEDVAEELQSILVLIEGETPAYQVQGLPRINALLVTAPATRGFSEVSRWIRILDAERQDQAEQLFQYRVKNLQAVELAATLTNVFSIEEERTTPPTTSFGRPRQTTPSSEASITIDEFGRPVVETRQVDPSADTSTTQGSARDNAQASAQERNQTDTVSADLRVNIVADEATNSLLIRANPRDYRQLLATINQLDIAPLQVMINAAIAQIVLTDDTAFGVDWSRILETATGETRISTSFLPSRDGDASALGGLLFNRAFLDGAARVEATLEAIAINNDIRLLARPSLMVINNQEGVIHIGSQVPVRLGETVGIGNSITNIQYRDIGIGLQLIPRINEDGVINLTIRQELSAVAEGSGVDSNPIFENQEIETTVVVRNGENVVLGGLIQTDRDQLNTGVPYINQVPVLGRLFSYQRDNNVRRELFIVIRPEIVNINTQVQANYQEMLSRFQLVSEMMAEF